MLLEIKGLSKKFGELQAVSNLDFRLEEKELLSIIGPNGAGKTTVFNMISGFIPPTSGQVIFKGDEITGFPPHLVAEKGICRTFQITAIFPGLTVLENVMVSHHRKLKASVFDVLSFNNRSREEEKQNREFSLQILNRVGLIKKKNELANNLSHGEQRLLEIAIALGVNPEILLLDEPVCGMNVEEVGWVMEMISGLREEYGLTIILVEHNMQVVMDVSDRIIVLNEGKKICEGPPQNVCQDDKVVTAYLGEKFARKK